MSTDRPAKTTLGQSCLSRFKGESLFELDCEDCVEFVTGRGKLDDAKNYARWHLDNRVLCEAVMLQDPDTGETIARVTETDFEWLSEQDMPPYVAGSQ